MKSPVHRYKTGKISLILIFLSIIISAGFSGYDYVTQRLHLRSGFEEMITPIPGHLAESLGKALWFMDKEQIGKIIDSQAVYQRIYAITVKDATGNSFAATRDQDWKFIPADKEITGEYVTRSEPISYNQKPVGQVDVYFSTRFEDEALHKLALSLVVKVLAVSLILVSALLLIIKQFLVKPVQRIINNLNRIGNEVSQGLDQLAQVTHQLNNGTCEQASAIEETSASLQQLSAMTFQNKENAGDANQRMLKASDMSFQVSAQIENLTASMQEIVGSSSQTRSIIKTIDEIGFQTNLLALNAAIEAARAGNVGAGFSIVADEVRQLSIRSGNATQETHALIETSINGVSAAHETMQQLNATFQGLTADLQHVKNKLDQVSTASEEQSQGITQISKAMNEIDRVTQENAGAADQTDATAKRMVAQMESMSIEILELVKLIGASKRHGT